LHEVKEEVTKNMTKKGTIEERKLLRRKIRGRIAEGRRLSSHGQRVWIGNGWKNHARGDD